MTQPWEFPRTPGLSEQGWRLRGNKHCKTCCRVSRRPINQWWLRGKHPIKWELQYYILIKIYIYIFTYYYIHNIYIHTWFGTYYQFPNNSWDLWHTLPEKHMEVEHDASPRKPILPTPIRSLLPQDPWWPPRLKVQPSTLTLRPCAGSPVDHGNHKSQVSWVSKAAGSAPY